MAAVPEFVFTLLNKELYDIQCRLLERVAADHGMDHTDLVERYLRDPLEIVPNTKTKVEVVRRQDPRPPPEPCQRCMARIWNRGKGGQCTRRRAGEGDYCANHAKGPLRHGRIDERAPKEVFRPSASSSLYK